MRTCAVAFVASATLLAAQAAGWQAPFDAINDLSVWNVIALGDDLVYGSGNDGALVAVSVSQGEPRWRFQVGTPGAASNIVALGPSGLSGIDDIIARRIILQSPAWRSPLVYVGSRHSKPLDLPNFYAIDGVTGRSRWSFFSPGGVFGPAVPVGNHVIVIGARLVHALDATTGAERWSFEPLEGLHQAARRAPDGALVDEESVYLTAWPAHQFDAPHHSYLFALDAATGKRRWSVDVAGNDVTKPVLHGDTVCFGVEEEENAASVYAVSKATGAMKWRANVEDASGIGTLSVRGDVVFVDAEGTYFRNKKKVDRVLALDPGTGAVKWTLAGWRLAKPMPAGRQVYGSQQRALAVLDPVTGRPERSIPLDDYSVVRLSDGQNLFVSSGRRLAAYEIATGRVRWERKLDSDVATVLLREQALFVATRGTSVVGQVPKAGRIYQLDASTGLGV